MPSRTNEYKSLEELTKVLKKFEFTERWEKEDLINLISLFIAAALFFRNTYLSILNCKTFSFLPDKNLSFFFPPNEQNKK